MITVRELIDRLSEYPDDAWCSFHDGIAVYGNSKKYNVGHITDEESSDE
jgi:hypothetical protein